MLARVKHTKITIILGDTMGDSVVSSNSVAIWVQVHFIWRSIVLLPTLPPVVWLYVRDAAVRFRLI